MKQLAKLITTCLMLLLNGAVTAQTKSCCSTHATQDFAMLGSDAGFQSAHLTPLPFTFVAAKGSDITFTVPGGQNGKAFLVPATKKSDNYLFVFHEWWGLNDYIRQEAERYAADFPEVNIMAIDLFDGQIATNAEDAGKLMQSVPKERAENIIKGALNHVGSKADIQTIGWCYGGAWSLQAAILSGKQAKGCVMYYGSPEKEMGKLSMLQAPVLGIFATNDNWITKQMVDDFEKQMNELKKPVTIAWFDAVHAFANPSNPKYDEAAAAKARVMAVGFLKNHFK